MLQREQPNPARTVASGNNCVDVRCPEGLPAHSKPVKQIRNNSFWWREHETCRNWLYSATENASIAIPLEWLEVLLGPSYGLLEHLVDQRGGKQSNDPIDVDTASRDTGDFAILTDSQ